MLQPELPGAIAYRRHLHTVSERQGFPAKQESVAGRTGSSPRDLQMMMASLAGLWRRRPTRRAPFPRVL